MSGEGHMSRWVSRYWLLVPLVLGAILIRNWVEEPETFMPDEPLGISESQADYLLENFTTRHYDETGALAYHLRGSMLAHFPDDNRAEILRPAIMLNRDSSNWTVTAESGKLTREPDVVTLIGSVRIKRAVEDDSIEPITIETSNISIALEDDELYTEDRVRMETPGLIVEADGLQSSIKEGKLKLLSKVSARYDVARPPVIPANKQ